jgi:Ni/Co efflux regulator RcnB
MKLKLLPILVLSLSAGSIASARPEITDGEVGPRFSVPQTRSRQEPQQQPQRSPQTMPQQPQNGGGLGRPHGGGRFSVQPSAPQAMPGNNGGNRNDAGNRNDNNQRNNAGNGQSRNPAPNWQVFRDRNRDDGDRNNYNRNEYDRYRANNYRYDQGRYFARQRFSIGYYWLPRGYTSRVWFIGEWLPFALYDDVRYHIDNPWRYSLYDAPIGCHWIRAGSEALLIDYYSGEILDVVYNLFW